MTHTSPPRVRGGIIQTARGIHLNSVQIDWALWEAAQGAPPDGKPYHRTRTVFY